MITRSIHIELEHQKRIADDEFVTRRITAAVTSSETNAPTLREWRAFETASKKVTREARRLYKECESFTLWVYATDSTYGNDYRYAWSGEVDEEGGLYFSPFSGGYNNTPETLDMYAESGDIVAELARIGF